MHTLTYTCRKSHTYMNTNACTLTSWVFKMHLGACGKQGHMHSGRYSYMCIEIKLASAISFLPRAAGLICKHQTAPLYKRPVSCHCLKASPHHHHHPPPPKPQLNKHSCVYTEHIFINCGRLHFNPWSPFHWRNCLTDLKLAPSYCHARGNKTKVRDDESCLLFFSFLFFFFPRFTFLCHADGN